MKFFIETIGCQQNEYDASRLSLFLKSAGFIEIDNPKSAEVIFILACSVRQTAVDRIFGRVKNWKDKKICITACVTDGDKKKLAEKGAIYWKFGDIKNLEKILNFDFNNRTIEQWSNSFYVPIMSGCNNFCSYCIVPYLRGREKSRPIKTIITEVKNLVKQGHKEIILLGQNVNSYKMNYESRIMNHENKKDFTVLLEKLNKIPGDFEIGFLTNHPKDMTDDAINAIAILPKVKKEIHLPLQSGSDKILKLMNRKYTTRQYLKIVKKLTPYNLRLTTDIIVGFPGETQSDFQKTVDVCKKINFDLAYINKYSPRKGTAAYKLGDPILWKEKQRRWRILNDLINK